MGSGFAARRKSRKEAGDFAANIGASIMVMCCKAPPGRLNSSAMPRGFGAASGASGSPPPSEKRATTGMVLPEKSADRLRVAAFQVPEAALAGVHAEVTFESVDHLRGGDLGAVGGRAEGQHGSGGCG